jgi:DNA-binding transcriptional LysR family regulator
VAELPHAVAGFGSGTPTPERQIFGGLHLDRRIMLRVFGFLPLFFVIEGTEMVAVVPETLARMHVGADGPLVVVEPPFGEVLLSEGYWYAPHRASDPAHRWLFSRLDAVGAELGLDALRPAPGDIG